MSNELIERALSALRELACTPMGISLSKWNELSGPLVEMTQALADLTAERDALREGMHELTFTHNMLIEHIGHKTNSGTAYRWNRLLSFQDGQRALHANNKAHGVLAAATLKGE